MGDCTFDLNRPGKDRSKANRGQQLEALIRLANDRYIVKKLAVIDKQATEFIPLRDRTGKIFSAKVEHKATVDFLGRYKHYPIAIEAKNTNTDCIRFDAVQPHQAEYMDLFTEEPGTIGLVVLCFSHKRFFAVPWKFWQAAYEWRVQKKDREKEVIVIAHGQTWVIPKKFSVKADELNPEWELPDFDTTYGLHYLQKADQYIIPEPRGTVK